MDELTDLVREACCLIRRAEKLAAHDILHQAAAAAERLPRPHAETLAPTLYAWLMLISEAASDLGGVRLDASVAAAFTGSTPVDAIVARFVERFTVMLDAVITAAPPRCARGHREAIHGDM